MPDQKKAAQAKRGGGKGKAFFREKLQKVESRENRTSPNSSPKHISGFRNMLLACYKSFFIKDL